MRSQVMIGIVSQSKKYKQALEHLHYAGVVVYLNGSIAHKVGRGLPVLAHDMPMGKRIVENLRVVWGDDIDLVCEELDRPHARTVFVSKNEPCAKIKARLGKRTISFGYGFSGVARVIASNNGLITQELINGEWSDIETKVAQKPTKPKNKKPKSSNTESKKK